MPSRQGNVRVCVRVCVCVCEGGHSRDTRKAKYRLKSPNRDFNARMISSKSSGRATAALYSRSRGWALLEAAAPR